MQTTAQVYDSRFDVMWCGEYNYDVEKLQLQFMNFKPFNYTLNIPSNDQFGSIYSQDRICRFISLGFCGRSILKVYCFIESLLLL